MSPTVEVGGLIIVVNYRPGWSFTSQLSVGLSYQFSVFISLFVSYLVNLV